MQIYLENYVMLQTLDKYQAKGLYFLLMLALWILPFVWWQWWNLHHPISDRMTLVHVQSSHQALKAATTTKSDCQLEPWGIVLMFWEQGYTSWMNHGLNYTGT